MTSDGLRHEGEMSAPTKDDVYAALRERGIRAIKVTERIQPIVRRGFRGLRKRDWCLIAAGVALAAVVLVVVIRLLAPAPLVQGPQAVGPKPRHVIESDIVEVRVGDRVARARPRRQFEISEEDLKVVFSRPADRYLAKFVAPGRICPPDASAELKEVEEDIFDALDTDIVIRSDDPKGVAELKCVVAGIRDEVRMLLSSGRTFAEVVDWLHNRQNMEDDYRKRLIQRYPNDEAEANRQLKNLGMAEIGIRDKRLGVREVGR